MLLLAAVLRLAFIGLTIAYNQSTEHFFTSDSPRYIESAQELYEHGRFWYQGEPEVVRTPGYPLFVALFYALPSSLFTLQLAQIFISLVSICFVFATLKLLPLSTRISTLGALLFAIEPLSILYSSLVMSETIFTCTVTAFIYCTVRFQKSPTLQNAVLLGLSLTIAMFVRPILYYLLPLLICALLVAKCRNRISTMYLRNAAVGLLCLLIPVCAWQLRNGIQTDYWGFSSVKDVNTYVYYASSIRLQEEHSITTHTFHDELYKDISQWCTNGTVPEPCTQGMRFREMRRQGLEVIKQDPLRYLAHHLAGSFVVLFEPGVRGLFRHAGLESVIGAKGAHYPEPQKFFGIAFVELLNRNFFIANVVLGIPLLAYILLATIGWQHVSDKPLKLFLLSMIIYLLLLSGGSLGQARYRHPIMPIFCILAAIGLESRSQKSNPKRPHRC